MRLLEEQARRIAEEAREDVPKKKAMSFVKYVSIPCSKLRVNA